ncbi:MAG: hypothetical protein IT564_03150 [Rhodospirillales bacterium]|nr:hypothetical protein [Rhodospirillales bacterium]
MLRAGGAPRIPDSERSGGGQAPEAIAPEGPSPPSARAGFPDARPAIALRAAGVYHPPDSPAAAIGES